jgi:hypothetical protein
MQSIARLADLPSTGEIASRVGLTEGQVNAIVRRVPGIRPPIDGNRRRWRPEDVEALTAYLARRRAPRPGRGRG